MTSNQDVESRIKALLVDPTSGKSNPARATNCLGTAAYILGYINTDYAIDPYDNLKEFLNRLKIIDLVWLENPELHSLAVFESENPFSFEDYEAYFRRMELFDEFGKRGRGPYEEFGAQHMTTYIRECLKPSIAHAGIITDLNPLKIVHRVGANGPIVHEGFENGAPKSYKVKPSGFLGNPKHSQQHI